MRLPITNKMPGGRETQKMLRQAVSLKANSLAASPSFATSSTRMLKNMPTRAAVTMPSVSSHWKIPVPLPRFDAARHSAKYSGTTTPIKPALMPCKRRPRTNGS